MKDISPIFHALCAIAIQALVGLFTGNLLAGGLAGCVLFLAREHTQAEYRWVAEFGGGKRANMPWWGGFDYRVWNLGSLLDFLVPTIACLLSHFVISFYFTY